MLWPIAAASLGPVTNTAGTSEHSNCYKCREKPASCAVVAASFTLEEKL